MNINTVNLGRVGIVNYPTWQENKEYETLDRVRVENIGIFSCLKDHIATSQNKPLGDSEFWMCEIDFADINKIHTALNEATSSINKLSLSSENKLKETNETLANGLRTQANEAIKNITDTQNEATTLISNKKIEFESFINDEKTGLNKKYDEVKTGLNSTNSELVKKADKSELPDVYTKIESNARFLSVNAKVTPVGTIIQSASQTTPQGYLKCNGASISRSDYQKLFEAIGTTFGSDDNNSFKLPDLRGRFVRGFSDGSSIDSGRTFGSSQNDENKEHYHLAPTGGGGGYSLTKEIAVQIYRDYLKNNGYEDIVGGLAIPPEVAATTTDSNGNFLNSIDFNPPVPTSKSGSESRPYNIALNFYIKY